VPCFGDRLLHCVELHQRDLRSLAVRYCYLDAFKTINDTLGPRRRRRHPQSRRGTTSRRDPTGDTVARMGGNECAIPLEDVSDAATVAARILDASTQSAMAARTSITVGNQYWHCRSPRRRPSNDGRRTAAARRHRYVPSQTERQRQRRAMARPSRRSRLSWQSVFDDRIGAATYLAAESRYRQRPT
jgi:hypothetical protein